MMHTGLSHFTGRGLPTIWSFISSNNTAERSSSVFPFTDNDAKVIGEWAKKLDDWLLSSNSMAVPKLLGLTYLTNNPRTV